MSKAFIKSLLSSSIGEYEFYRIYRFTLPGPEVKRPEAVTIICNIDPAVLLEHPEQKMRSAYRFCRAGSLTSFAIIDSCIVGVSSIWDQALTYLSMSWLIKEDECVLVNIVTAENFSVDAPSTLTKLELLARLRINPAAANATRGAEPGQAGQRATFQKLTLCDRAVRNFHSCSWRCNTPASWGARNSPSARLLRR
jgi:hypothetical protein